MNVTFLSVQHCLYECDFFECALFFSTKKTLQGRSMMVKKGLLFLYLFLQTSLMLAVGIVRVRRQLPWICPVPLQGVSSIPSPNTSNVSNPLHDSYLPTALRKGNHSCTHHPISNHANHFSYDVLSPLFWVLSNSLSFISILCSVAEAHSTKIARSYGRRDEGIGKKFVLEI